MTERNQSKLQFSIEESVWLNKGQEVEELYTVALNPDVTIEEVDDQICIKGYLCLTGEYRCPDQGDGELSSEESNFLGYRSFSQLNEATDDVVKLDHRFPVDITLPKNRVHDKDELYVAVDNFDYEMPTPSCIEVSAAISVSGVYESQGYTSGENEHQEYVYQNDEVYESREDDDNDHELYEGGSNPFPILEFEARRSPDSETQEEEVSDYNAARREPQVEFSSRAEERFDRSASYEHHFMRDSVVSQYEDDDYEEEEYRPEDYEDDESQAYYYEEEESDEEYEYEDQEEVQPSAERPPREENALYLTKMLTRDDEELAKMKMCIIQAGDSLDSIAGRYDIPPSQLMRVNRLESEEIEEGQILYIPVSAR